MLERDVPSLPDSVGDRLRLVRQWVFSTHRVYALLTSARGKTFTQNRR